MAYTGFQALQGKIQAEGHSAKSAGAIAAAIGRRKYGASTFQKAASKGTSLRGAAAKKALRK